MFRNLIFAHLLCFVFFFSVHLIAADQNQDELTGVFKRFYKDGSYCQTQIVCDDKKDLCGISIYMSGQNETFTLVGKIKRHNNNLISIKKSQPFNFKEFTVKKASLKRSGSYYNAEISSNTYWLSQSKTGGAHQYCYSMDRVEQ